LSLTQVPEMEGNRSETIRPLRRMKSENLFREKKRANQKTFLKDALKRRVPASASSLERLVECWNDSSARESTKDGLCLPTLFF